METKLKILLVVVAVIIIGTVSVGIYFAVQDTRKKPKNTEKYCSCGSRGCGKSYPLDDSALYHNIPSLGWNNNGGYPVIGCPYEYINYI